MTKKISVIGFSSYSNDDSLEKGADWLRANGFIVDIPPQVYARHGQSAGTIQDKVQAFENACNDCSVDFIMAACGGNGAVHLLPHIDLSQCHKPIIGFSDTTTILNAAPHGGIHGPTLERLGRDMDKAQQDHFLSVLRNAPAPVDWQKCKVIRAGEITGKCIYGGNLSTFQTLLGTPSMPDCRDAVLFFEDCDEEISRIDRMLGHLDYAGLFDNAAAVIFGQFTHMTDTGRKPYGRSIEDVIAKYTEKLSCPAVINAPFGHGRDLWALPVGQKIDMNVTDGGVHMTLYPFE